MSVRHYSNTATEATLTSGITAVDTTFALTSFADYPSAPFTAAISRGDADEEIILVSVVSGSTVTATRGFDGTTAKSHAAGASFLHVVVAKDYDEANTHVNANSGVHGVTGSVVGTSDVQTLTNKTLTSPVLQSPTATGTSTVAAQHVTGSQTVDGTQTIAGAVTAAGGLTVPAGQDTSLDDLTAATGAFSGSVSVAGNETVAGTLTVTGAATAATVTGTGLVKGTPVESASELVLAQLSADPAGVASKGKVWAKTDGGIYTRSGATTAAVRIPVHWGSGTSLPTSGVLAGDTYIHTGMGAYLRYNGAGWRQVEPGEVANDAARLAISTNFSALLYPGFRVRQADIQATIEWDGTRWLTVAWDGAWVVDLNSTTYNYGLPATPNTNIPGGVTATISIPPGRTLDAEFSVTQVNVSGTGTGNVQLWSDSTLLDGAFITAAGMNLPLKMTGSLPNNTNATKTGTVSVSAWISAGAMTLFAGNGIGFVRLRHRIS